MPPALSNWLSLDDALQQILSLAPADVGSEDIVLAESLSRIVAKDILAPVSLPQWDNSAMDGYAVRISDLSQHDSLPISGSLLAGESDTPPLTAGTAIRIMTGAPIPEGADTVIIQENATVKDNRVMFSHAAVKGENVRPSGSDIQQGECVISKGTRLAAGHLMLLASLGITHVCAQRKVKVGLMATGDELCHAGQPLGPGQIYESNTAGISALLSGLGVEVINYGIVRDDIETLTNTIRLASTQVNILITSGGVSVGDADHVKSVVAYLGTVDFWKVAIKPGKPFALGRVGDMVFCGVPGNPVSAYVTTQMLVTPVVERLQGLRCTTAPLAIQARLDTSITRRAGRTDFQRARMWQVNGTWHVKPLPKQSSGVMSSITEANCYLVLPAEQAEFDAGIDITVLPFSLRHNRENAQ